MAIETLRELDKDIWEILARCFQFKLLNHWTVDADTMWSKKLVTIVKRKTGDAWVSPNCNTPNDISSILQNSAAYGGPSTEILPRPTVRPRPGPGARSVHAEANGGTNNRVADTNICDGLRRSCNIRSCFTPCDSRSHGGHKSSSRLIAAWIRKYRGPETLVTLDDILTRDSPHEVSTPGGSVRGGFIWSRTGCSG